VIDLVKNDSWGMLAIWKSGRTDISQERYDSLCLCAAREGVYNYHEGKVYLECSETLRHFVHRLVISSNINFIKKLWLEITRNLSDYYSRQ